MLNKLFPFKSQFKPSPIDLCGRKALIITTSQSTLDKYNPKTDTLEKKRKKTGVYASEMTEPYYTFSDAGMQVDVASIAGGKIPIDPLSMIYPARTDEDWRYAKDPIFQQKAEQSLKIDDLNILDYDIIFISGGWGAAYDLAQSEVLSNKISEAYANKKILASVCHGALGFIGAQKPDGSPLVEGVRVTGVTNSQLKHLGISRTPKHPETELRNARAIYEYKKGSISDIFSNCVVLDEDHNMVSGQNQKAGVEAAYTAMSLLKKKI